LYNFSNSDGLVKPVELSIREWLTNNPHGIHRRVKIRNPRKTRTLCQYAADNYCSATGVDVPVPLCPRGTPIKTIEKLTVDTHTISILAVINFLSRIYS
jgi:hypothetical protein